MPAFRTSGSTGIAPTTVFLGPIPDRFSMGRAIHYVSSLNMNQIDSFAPTNYINTWTPYNTFIDTGAGTNAATVSLGATTTAPDGTNSGNAQKIVEAANTGVHSSIVNANVGVLGGYGGWSMRFAVMAKAAERTRIALTMAANGNNSGGGIIPNNGCQTIFDLAGARIGVANTAVNNGSNPTPIPGQANITSFGGGWCLCMMDMFLPFIQNTYQGVWCSFGVDSGSGTGAASVSYAGDGTSGVYAWRSSILPPSAWAMSGAKTFFSGFDSINEIDVNNTKTTGYKWYTNNIFPGGGFNSSYHPAVVPTPSAQISVSGSILTLQQWNGQFLQTQLMSAASIGDNTDMGVVGNTFVPPFLFESKVSMDNVNPGGGSAYDQWAQNQGTLGIGPHAFTGLEMDFGGFQSAYNLSGSVWTWIIGTDNTKPGGPFFPWASYADWVGYQAWNPVTNYNSNEIDIASLGGVAYYAITAPPTNNINNPPPNGTYWAVVPTPSTNVTSYNFIDYNVMNVYNTLVLPTPHNDTGWFINFFNGAPCGNTPVANQASFAEGGGLCIPYNPYISQLGNDGGGYYQHWDTDPIILLLFAGNSGTGNPAQFEYVSVTQ